MQPANISATIPDRGNHFIIANLSRKLLFSHAMSPLIIPARPIKRHGNGANCSASVQFCHS